MHPETGLPDSSALGVYQRTVLVADDDVMTLKLIRMLLQRQSYEVLTAFDGQEALEISRKHQGTIDLLITDVEMPKLNGIALSRYLLEERRGIKVLVMSGADKGKSVRQNMLFLPKPFEGKALLASVREALELPKPSLNQL